MNVAELKQKISKNQFEHIYLFSGPEIGEKKEVIELLENKIFNGEEPVVYNFYMNKDLETDELIDALEGDLLFSDSKIVYLKNIEEINQKIIKIIENFIIPSRLNKVLYDQIVESFKTDKESATILNNSYQFDDLLGTFALKDIKESDKKRLVGIFNKLKFSVGKENSYIVMLNETNDKIPAGLLNLLSQNQHIIFWEMFDNQKPTWIRGEFRKYNLLIDDDAINFIIDTVENNKYDFEKEIEKIFIYYSNLESKKNIVDKTIIENYLYHSKEETPFSLYSALLAKDCEKALSILDKIFWTDEDGIVGGLIWSRRRFLKILHLVENEKNSPDAALDKMFIKPKKIREELEKGFRNYNFLKASLLSDDLSELEYYQRVFPSDLKLIKFQEFIVKFIYGDSRKSFLQGKNQFLLY